MLHIKSKAMLMVPEFHLDSVVLNLDRSKQPADSSGEEQRSATVPYSSLTIMRSRRNTPPAQN